ncbi:unnamed protein product [Pleuronectes platessa]|uniref:Uncharacterized protein n=1 Tax=Pleuronectes platessa TaxID=8262 RepID=A0A9N7Y8Q4_PLEPL|nr:unnamed protein product [Pleuronectes platessa]
MHICQTFPCLLSNTTTPLPLPVNNPPPISQSQTHLIWGVIAGADLWQGVERSDCCASLSAEDEIEENSAQETPSCCGWLPRLVPGSERTAVPTGSRHIRAAYHSPPRRTSALRVTGLHLPASHSITADSARGSTSRGQVGGCSRVHGPNVTSGDWFGGSREFRRRLDFFRTSDWRQDGMRQR